MRTLKCSFSLQLALTALVSWSSFVVLANSGFEMAQTAIGMSSVASAPIIVQSSSLGSNITTGLPDVIQRYLSSDLTRFPETTAASIVGNQVASQSAAAAAITVPSLPSGTIGYFSLEKAVKIATLLAYSRARQRWTVQSGCPSSNEFLFDRNRVFLKSEACLPFIRKLLTDTPSCIQLIYSPVSRGVCQAGYKSISTSGDCFTNFLNGCQARLRLLWAPSSTNATRLPPSISRICVNGNSATCVRTAISFNQSTSRFFAGATFEKSVNKTVYLSAALPIRQMGFLSNMTLSMSNGALFDWFAVSISISGAAFGAGPFEYWTDMFSDIQYARSNNQLTIYMAPVVPHTIDFTQQFLYSPAASNLPPTSTTCPSGSIGVASTGNFSASLAACMKLIWFGANVFGNLNPPDNLFPPYSVQSALSRIENDGPTKFMTDMACSAGSLNEITSMPAAASARSANNNIEISVFRWSIKLRSGTTLIDSQAVVAACASLLQQWTAGKTISYGYYTDRQDQAQFTRFNLIYATLPFEAVSSLRQRFSFIQFMTILSEPSDDIVDSDVDRSIKSCRPSSVGENRRFRRDTIPQQKYFQPEMFVNTFDFQLFARGIGHNTIIHVLLPHFPADKNVLSQDCPNLFFSEDIGSDNLSEDTDFVISSICAISKNLRIILYVSGSENFEEGIAAMFNNIYDTIDRNPKEFHIINFLIESQSLANWQEAFQRWFQPAFDKKVLVISAAGSSSTDDPIKMPWTTQPYVISVGGVVYANSQEVPILYSTSNYGLNVPIYAPARSAYYPNNGDQNIEKFGTSFAAARFAAIVGLIANQVILQVDPGDDLIKIAAIKGHIYDALKGPMSASAWDPGLYSQITQEFSSQRNNIWLSLRALKVSLAGLQRIVIEISNRFSFFAPSADDYCKDVPITDISNWEQQGLSFKINNLGQFGKQLPKGTQFIVAAYPLPTLGKINFQILSNSVADLLTRDMMNRYMQRLFDFCVPAVNCNPRPTQLNTPVVLGEPQMAANQELLVSIPVSNTALTEQKTYQLLQCLNIYRPITTFCLPDNSCRNVELIFASAILIDGLGDAIGAARTIKLISQLFPGATFRVVIADWYLGYNSFNIFQKNSWPLGYKKFMEMISKFGLNDRISAVVLDETNTEIICNSISESNNGLVISGPSGSFYMICDGNFENHLQILELDNSDISYGLKDNGMGMPLPSDDEIAFISTYNFQNPQLAQLFQQSSPKPLLVYMKDRARLVSFVKEARAFIGTASSLPVILLGYKAKSGEIPISAELCESLLNVAVTEYSTDGQSTVNTVSCSNVAVGRVNIYNFGDMVILHDDFMLAVSKSYDIVGVTGDQSFLEALALGKIPVRDNILHKYNFDKALRDYYVKIVGIDSTLIKFLDNVQNPAARQAISSDQLPLMKQHMQTIVGKMRSDLDPMPRVRQVIENKISTMPTDEI